MTFCARWRTRRRGGGTREGVPGRRVRAATPRRVLPTTSATAGPRSGQSRTVWGVTLLGHVPCHAEDQGAGVAADPTPLDPVCREETRRFAASIAAHEEQHVQDIWGIIRRVNIHWRDRRRVDACGATPAEARAKARAASRRLADAELERLNMEHLRLAEAFDTSPEGRVYTPMCQNCDACEE